MGCKFQRIKNNIISIASRFVLNYKNYLLVFFIIFLFGFLTGIFTCSSYSSDLEIDKLINKYLYDFLCGEITYFSYFLTLAIFFLIVCVITIFLVRNKFMVVFNVFLLFIMAYIYAFDMCIVIICLGLSGVVCGALFLGVFGVVFFIFYMCIMAIIAKSVIGRDKCYVEFKYVLHNCSYFFVLALITLFLSSILFATIHIFVIIE